MTQPLGAKSIFLNSSAILCWNSPVAEAATGSNISWPTFCTSSLFTAWLKKPSPFCRVLLFLPQTRKTHFLIFVQQFASCPLY